MMMWEPGGVVARVGKKVRGKAGASDGETWDGAWPPGKIMPLGMLPLGAPMSVVDNRTLGYDVAVEAELFATT
jgi:hypothetical protein